MDYKYHHCQPVVEEKATVYTPLGISPILVKHGEKYSEAVTKPNRAKIFLEPWENR